MMSTDQSELTYKSGATLHSECDCCEHVAKRIAELEAALKLSAERWQDVGEIISEDGKYDDSGFCKATARRCFNVLEGKEWGDPAGIFSAITNK